MRRGDCQKCHMHYGSTHTLAHTHTDKSFSIRPQRNRLWQESGEVNENLKWPCPITKPDLRLKHLRLNRVFQLLMVCGILLIDKCALV